MDSDEEEMAALRASRLGGAKAKQPAKGGSDDEAPMRRSAPSQPQRIQRPPPKKVAKDSSDEELVVEDTPAGFEGFLPTSFGRMTAAEKQRQEIERRAKDLSIHLANARIDGKAAGAKTAAAAAGVQVGRSKRLTEASTAAAAHDRAVKKAVEAAVAAEAEKAAGVVEDEGEERMEVEEQGRPDERDEVVPAPGRESEVIPVSHEVSIPAHEKLKAVTALGLDVKASRMSCGFVDGSVKLYDFNGMSEAKSSFRSLEPVDGHLVQATSWNCSGSVILIISSDSHARLFDRDGSATPLQTTVKGDMYVRNCEHTQGHTQMLTDGMFHPFQPELWLTSSLDGTMRLWDINAKAVGMDQQLPAVHVLKTVNKRNVCVGGAAGRDGGLHPTCCVYSPADATKLVGGCSDGSVQMFFQKARYQRADRILRTAHTAPVTGITFIKQGNQDNLMVTRAMDNTMKVWDCRMLNDAKGPVKVFEDLPAGHEKTGLCCSPDGRFLVTGTSFVKGAAMGSATLQVYDTKTFAQERSLDFGSKSITKLAWPEEINQLVVGTTVGEVVMLYSPFSSKKGALHFVGRKARTKKAEDAEDLNPHMPIFNYTDKDDIQRFWVTGRGSMTQIRRNEARHQQKTIVPERPSEMTPTDMGHSFQAMVLKKGGKFMNAQEQDSQKALLAYADGTDKAEKRKGMAKYIDSVFTGGGPKILDYTVDQSEGDKRMSEIMGGDFCRKCGQKVCRCVDYSIYGGGEGRRKQVGQQSGYGVKTLLEKKMKEQPDAKKQRQS
eukprot:TRINITY_DN16389_c0_g1_i1.p1 TRINITY_DN16389_c0_g1~~TRINITY_DN16389_c0_g1_i1.p1  ORF type:complete len:775 (+),score=226.05 TRINITY_DN16389_c0_g1_i1:84-2408(+)